MAHVSSVTCKERRPESQKQGESRGGGTAEVAGEPHARLVAPRPGKSRPRWVLTWIFPSSPVLSIRLATLTVFPQMSY